MRPAAHILPWLTAAVLVLTAAPASAGPTTPADPPRDADPQVTDRTIVGDGAHEAGVLVDDGDEVRTSCVRFDEDELDGEELLRRTGADLEVEHFGTLGAAVCAIDGVGCPADDCFCTAAFWSYWQGDGTDGWSSSPVGPRSRTVRDGDRDARAWGDGRREPPPIAVDEICDATLADATSRPAEEATGEGRDAPRTLADPATLASFLALLGLLLGAVWWVRRRRPS